ncbi:MAG: hypothetical protein ACRC80_04950, partial [Waterburya sp.]
INYFIWFFFLLYFTENIQNKRVYKYISQRNIIVKTAYYLFAIVYSFSPWITVFYLGDFRV